MKKLFPEDREGKKRILEFLDKKAFYIVLVLCIAIVAGTAVFVTHQKTASDKARSDAERVIPRDANNDSAADVAGSATNPVQTGNVSGDAVKSTSDSGKTTSGADKTTKPATPAKKEESKITPTPTKPKNAKPAAKATTKKTSAGTAKIEFDMPVTGQITFDYAKDKLTFSKTLEEWRTHEGIDISAERGSTVKAAADGVVTEVKNDPRFGIIVVIEHKNGFKTVYANLASDDSVSPNQKVKKGDVIGSVGNTAVFEAAEQSHLHFEVLKNNSNINPSSVVPVKQVAN